MVVGVFKGEQVSSVLITINNRFSVLPQLTSDKFVFIKNICTISSGVSKERASIG